MKIRDTQRIEKFGVEARMLSPGRTVRGRVVKKISRGRFRISAEGILFDAASDLELEEGQRLTAQVEVQDDRVYLRIQDEPRPAASPPRNETPDEIALLLRSLGNQPDSLDIVEFQERLERCRKYGHFPDVPPSDAWVLAILWTRGIRAGSDAFALLSYYLRGITLNLPPAIIAGDLNVGIYKQIYLLCDPDTAPTAADPPRGGSQQNGLLRRREEEAIRLLNREASALGRFQVVQDQCPLPYRLLGVRGGSVELRLTDHPVIPSLVIEAERSGGEIAYRTHTLTRADPDADADDNERRTDLIAELRAEEIETEAMEFIQRDDPETLRALFWKNHKAESSRNFSI